MTTEFIESIPFLFSLVLKLGSSWYSIGIKSEIINNIPDDYDLTEAAKKTIANLGLGAIQKFTFITSWATTFLAALIIIILTENSTLLIVTAGVLLLVGFFGFIILFSIKLGRLFVPRKIKGISDKYTWYDLINYTLIIFDLFILGLINFLPIL